MKLMNKFGQYGSDLWRHNQLHFLTGRERCQVIPKSILFGTLLLHKKGSTKPLYCDVKF